VDQGVFNGELPYWLGVTSGPLPRLPRDSGGARGSVRSLRAVSAKVAGQTAARLMGESHGAFRTRGLELFVAAFRTACTQWNPGNELYLLLEGHGREPGACDLDVSRTVGWFTAVYPVRFAPAPVRSADLVRETKEVLRRVPRNGVGFGWLRACSANTELASRALPEIGFNFLGDFGGAAEGGAFALSSERPAHAQDIRQPIPQPLSVYGYAAGGALHWTIEYDETRLPESAARGLLDRFMAALADVAAFTSAEAARVQGGMPSPSDFTFSKLELPGRRRRKSRAPVAARYLCDTKIILFGQPYKL
jgi:non-ribosomal peptide synthase protein (TIGR01720 family)